MAPYELAHKIKTTDYFKCIYLFKSCKRKKKLHFNVFFGTQAIYITLGLNYLSTSLFFSMF